MALGTVIRPVVCKWTWECDWFIHIIIGGEYSYFCKAIPVLVVSNHATYTMTLNLAGYSLSATTITASTRGIISSSVAGAKLIAGTGGITVAANGTLDRTNISYIESRGNVDLSAGTSVMGKERWVIKPNVSGISLNLGAGQKFYDLLIETVKATLLSNVTVNRIFAHVNPLVKGAYTLTLDAPAQEYTGIRRPLQKAKIKAVGLDIASWPLLEDLEE